MIEFDVRPVHDVLFAVLLGILLGVFLERTGRRTLKFVQESDPA